MFDEDPSILYFSTHRCGRGDMCARHTRSYDHGMFYPGSPIADPSYVGKGSGKGFTVNIGWNERGIGDKESVLRPAGIS